MTIKLNFSSNCLSEDILSNNPFDHENKGHVHTLIEKIIAFLGTNRIFLYLSFAHLFTLVHEFGHALAYKMITGKGSTIYMSPNHCFGLTVHEEIKDELTVLQNIWVTLSGHLATVLFSAIIILGIFALTYYLAMPLGLIIALRIIVAVPITLRILGEGSYAISSACKNANNGDFGSIRKIGDLPAVFLCAALLISLVALCIIGVIFLF